MKRSNMVGFELPKLAGVEGPVTKALHSLAAVPAERGHQPAALRLAAAAWASAAEALLEAAEEIDAQ